MNSVDFLPKTFLILYPCLENSTTGNAIFINLLPVCPIKIQINMIHSMKLLRLIDFILCFHSFNFCLLMISLSRVLITYSWIHHMVSQIFCNYKSFKKLSLLIYCFMLLMEILHSYLIPYTINTILSINLIFIFVASSSNSCFFVSREGIGSNFLCLTN